MNLVTRFVKQLEVRGLTVEYRDSETLSLVGPSVEKTPEVLAACKAYKAELLKLLAPRIEAAVKQADNPANVVRPEPPGEYCQPCNSTVYDKETAAKLCPMAGDRHGLGRCPYKESPQ